MIDVNLVCKLNIRPVSLIIGTVRTNTEVKVQMSFGNWHGIWLLNKISQGINPSRPVPGQREVF